ILCAIVAGVVFYGWYRADEWLPESFKDYQQKLRTEFTRIDAVARRQLAGPTWAEDAQKKTRTLQAQLLNFAKTLSQSQAIDRQWPDKLSEQFQSAVSRTGPKGTL